MNTQQGMSIEGQACDEAQENPKQSADALQRAPPSQVSPPMSNIYYLIPDPVDEVLQTLLNAQEERHASRPQYDGPHSPPFLAASSH